MSFFFLVDENKSLIESIGGVGGEGNVISSCVYTDGTRRHHRRPIMLSAIKVFCRCTLLNIKNGVVRTNFSNHVEYNVFFLHLIVIFTPFLQT